MNVIGTGKTRGIDRGASDLLAPVVELFNESGEEPSECRGSNPLTELMDCREMGNYIQVDLLSK